MSFCFIPDNVSPEVAKARTRYLAIVAHPDDLEFMCFDGIGRGFSDKSFAGIVLSGGGGSARSGRFANVSNQEMIQIRQKEQMEAAKTGNYSFVDFWNLESAELKNPVEQKKLLQKMQDLLVSLNLERLYIHNPFDRHVTHVASSLLVLNALRLLPQAKRPKLCLGGELWRSLDWILPKYRIIEDVSSRFELQKTLLEMFPSQTESGKSYVEAMLGRRRSNAVLIESHSVDKAVYVETFLNLESFLNSKLDLEKIMDAFLLEHSDNLKKEIRPFLV